MKNNIIISNLDHTWILDLDGTILEHNGYKNNGHDTILKGSLDFLNLIPKNDFILFLTSRKNIYKNDTISFLKKNKIRFNKIIFNCPVGERIVINDIKPSTNLKTALAFCKKRNSAINYKIIIDDSL